jgi:NO-binding membrane sensor protein with MHYT domain
MPVTHEPWLVVLSIVVAIQGAYVGLSMAVQVGGAVGLRQRLLLAGSALSLGVAIWSMHFVGMLAARLPTPVDYLVLPTLLSFLICVIVVGAAVFAASAGLPTLTRLTLSACLMGVGIFTMHYIGMMALHASAHMRHSPEFAAASLAVAIGASGLALYLATAEGRRPPLYLSAIAFGLAISGMHYTAMAGLTVFPHATPTLGAPALSTDLLAIVVAVVAFCVSGVFLLILVPDRDNAEAAPRVAAPAADPLPAVTGETAELGRASIGPLGGAGGPPRKFARHLPVERDGTTHYVTVDSVVAVHANAHYTTIFDGTTKLFCPLPISDVESRLDNSRFVRVHRSHIVNIERVVRVKRAGDSGMVELAAADHYAVPVSRSRVGWLKSRIGSKTGEPATQSM